VAVRNPYFHRVDAAGLQLPYIDRIVLQVAEGKLIPAKTGAGESDLQARDIQFNNYTFLKKGEKTNNYRTLLWKSARGSHIALFPNLNASDPAWRAVLRDVRVRRALSLAIDRAQIPERGCDRIAELGIRGRSFNRFHQGGYLLWRFYPERDRLPFMDIHQAGTSEIRRLYMFAFEREQYWRELDGRFDFEWMLLPRRTYAADRLVDVIDADSTWALVFLDDVALVFVRRRGPMAAVADSFAYRILPAGNARLSALAPLVTRDSVMRAAFRGELERQARESPFTAQAHEMLATVALIENRPDQAREHLQRSLVIDPAAAEVRKRLESLRPPRP